MNKPYDLEERLIDFAVDVINVLEVLPTSMAGNHIANQLVRSGTSPAPNFGNRIDKRPPQALPISKIGNRKS